MRIIFAGAMALLLLPVAGRAAEPVAFYVSPAGSDDWTGRLPAANAGRSDGPFATVARARDAVRQARQGDAAPRPYRVLLRGGIYRLNETLLFTPEDSGTPGAPVTYAAYPDEKPVLSGGRPITGWRKGEGGVWTAEVPQAKAGAWYFHQLFVNGERRQRARHPNQGYLTTAGPLPGITPNRDDKNSDVRLGFTYRAGDLKPWAGLEDVNVTLYYDWDTSMHWIAGLDEAARTVRFTNPSQWPVCYWERQQRYHLENFAEACDSPGEWFLDRKRGVLSYRPLPGERPDRAQIVAPYLRRLVEVRGEPEKGRFVEGLALEGISFQHADWDLEKTKCAQMQAAVFLGAAIFGKGVRRCTFTRCEVAHVGEYALWLERGCKENRVVHSEFRDLGGGGIRIGPEGVLGEEHLQSGFNTVDNCWIHHGGYAFSPAVGIWVGQSGDNTLTHNEISDLYYTGISAGWSWGYGPSLAHRNVIEENHIHDLGFGVLSELSAVYTLGIAQGTRIRNNLLHDTYDYRYGSWGIGLDEGTSNVVVEGNVVYNHGYGIGLNYGHENVIRNNVIANSRVETIGGGRVEKEISWRVDRNVFLSGSGTLAGAGWALKKMVSERNLWWDPAAGADLEIDGRSFTEWQALGFDKSGLAADPRFVDPSRGDFRFRRDSPAPDLGIQPFDLRGAGLYGERDWVDAPKRIRRQPVHVAARPGPLRAFADDFEGTPAGDAPRLATVSSEGAASIQVSDESAAGGKHSLKFTDAPGLRASWQPHLWYSPSLRRGTASLSFDVRLEQGALLVHQWRDYRLGGDNFKCGPTLAFAAGGKLLAGDRPIADVPVSQWLHVEVTCLLGAAPGRTWQVQVTMPGLPAVEVAGLPVAEEFQHFQWIGFISDATNKAVLYVDNVRLNGGH